MPSDEVENCQSRGRGFKSRRARHKFNHFGDGSFLTVTEMAPKLSLIAFPPQTSVERSGTYGKNRKVIARNSDRDGSAHALLAEAEKLPVAAGAG